MKISDILEYFEDINHVYNDCMRYSELKRMLYQLVYEVKRSSGCEFPVLKWQAFEYKVTDSEIYKVFYSLYKQLPHDVNIILYGRQKYSFNDEWEYFSILVTLTEHENDISKFDVIFDWDYDEGQEYREWLAFADLDNIGTYEAGKIYEEVKGK